MVRQLLSAVLFLGALWFVPSWWCGRGAQAWYNGDAPTQERLANTVEQWIAKDVDRDVFATGSDLFDGEWVFGTYMMAAMGFGQMALEHPQWRERNVQAMERCIEQILTQRVRSFDREIWGNDPIDTLDQLDQHHAAYLGYLNLVLSLYRNLEPDGRFASLHDRITTALVQRLESSDLLLLQTYPGQMFPVDNCAVIGSIALFDRATGGDHSDLISRWVQMCRQRYVDPQSGLLIQAVSYRSGNATDEPRGSGTLLGIYFLSFVDSTLSAELYAAAREKLPGGLCGFTLMREYPPTSPGGPGDIDSGPLFFGYGVSPTGFAMAAARSHRDAELFKSLYASAHLFGSPVSHDDKSEFVIGGPLGNAMMFALLTSQPAMQREAGQ